MDSNVRGNSLPHVLLGKLASLFAHKTLQARVQYNFPCSGCYQQWRTKKRNRVCSFIQCIKSRWKWLHCDWNTSQNLFSWDISRLRVADEILHQIPIYMQMMPLHRTVNIFNMAKSKFTPKVDLFFTRALIVIIICHRSYRAADPFQYCFVLRMFKQPHLWGSSPWFIFHQMQVLFHSPFQKWNQRPRK